MRHGFPYCKGFEKLECPGIFFSLLSMIPAGYHWEKKETKQKAGFYWLWRFWKWNAWPYFSLFFPWFVHTVSRGKRKLNMRQGFTYCKGFENGNAWPYFSLFFPWCLQGIKGKKGNVIWCRVLRSVKVLKKGIPELIFLFSFLETCPGKIKWRRALLSYKRL